MRTLGFVLVGLGYLAAIPGQLTDPITVVLLLVAGGGALAAATGFAGRGAPLALLGLLGLAGGRTLQATKGTLLGNWPFALPAWIVAAGLLFLAWRAWQARPAAPAPGDLRPGLAAAAVGTLLIAAWLAGTGNIVSLVGAVLAALGYGLAWASPGAMGTAARPAREGA